MFKSFSPKISQGWATALLVLVLPLAGCVTDDWAKDDNAFKPYGGSKAHPIAVVGNKASVQGCGEWSVDGADAGQNEMLPNHGCAVQANIAAMTAYPQDLVKLRRMSRAPAESRVAAVKAISGSAVASSAAAPATASASPSP
jgi:Pilus biogenesis CpaD protein (pilus_cpaD)